MSRHRHVTTVLHRVIAALLVCQPVVVCVFDVFYKLSLSLLNHHQAYCNNPAHHHHHHHGLLTEHAATTAFCDETGVPTGAPPKAAPALTFDWPTPSMKLATAQLAIAKLTQQVTEQERCIAEQDRCIAEQEAALAALDDELRQLTDGRAREKVSN